MSQALENLQNELNPYQYQAVTTSATNCLVLAGAGSGKTRVLVHRIAYLAREKNIDSRQILAVTFTNKAAAEMKQRASIWLGEAVHDMWLGTFHSLAHRFLRRHHHEAALNERFQIIDAEDQLRLIKRLLKARNLNEDRFVPREVAHFINAQKDEGLAPKDVPSSNDPFRHKLAELYALYQHECQQAGLVDFGELLLRLYQLWRDDSDLRTHYQQRFRAVLVDEFQDTNSVQYNWLRLFATPQTQVMIVGDDDQSIYGWRGAKVENLRRFTHDFKPIETIRLEQNYRSTGTILSAANAVIAQNTQRMGKQLWTQGEQGDLITLYESFNEEDEAQMLVDQIKHFEQRGYKYSDCAILYRSNAQSRVIETYLSRADIPYRIYGGVRFFERQEIKDALGYLRLMFNRDNNEAFERVINVPARGIGTRTLAMIREFAQLHDVTLWQSAQTLLQTQQLNGRATKTLTRFCILIDDMSKRTQTMSLPQQMEAVLQDSGLLDFYQNDKREKSQIRLENLQELISATQAFIDEQQTLNADTSMLASFLNQTALDVGDQQTTDNQAQLMTLHASKGLEFPAVFIVGLEEGLFPSHNSVYHAARLEEERRLCYVGMTRAQQHLFLSYATCRRLYGREMRARASRFIGEIPAEYIKSTRPQIKTRPTALFKTDSCSFTQGTRVHHPVFGQGVILGTKGAPEQQHILINFGEQGTKWLMLQYAKLDVLEDSD